MEAGDVILAAFNVLAFLFLIGVIWATCKGFVP